MKLRTEIEPIASSPIIAVNTPILTIGSCFAEVMGSQLIHHKFNVLANPFGTIFNPVSIHKLIQQTLQQTPPHQKLYTNQQNLWFHYDFHSSFWAESKEELTTQLVAQQKQVHDFLIQKPVVILTLGSAFVYRHLSNQIVANCHKSPAADFEKQLLDYHYLTSVLEQTVALLRPVSSAIVLTVSPVRHTKDTLSLNQVSKSLLRASCYQICQHQPSVYYFPSYEMMIDDLRDYRFYKPDLIHPTEQAEQYIFDKFVETYLDKEAQQFLVEWGKIKQSLNHRPLQPNSDEHQKFLHHLLQKLQAIDSFVAVKEEILTVERQLL
jgi:GSCFA family